MLMLKPKFLENKDWYFQDMENPLYLEIEEMCYRLTDKAPKEAVESYLDYCEESYSYDLGYVPEFVYEEYRKHMARFEQPTQQN